MRNQSKSPNLEAIWLTVNCVKASFCTFAIVCRPHVIHGDCVKPYNWHFQRNNDIFWVMQPFDTKGIHFFLYKYVCISIVEVIVSLGGIYAEKTDSWRTLRCWRNLALEAFPREVNDLIGTKNIHVLWKIFTHDIKYPLKTVETCSYVYPSRPTYNCLEYTIIGTIDWENSFIGRGIARKSSDSMMQAIPLKMFRDSIRDFFERLVYCEDTGYIQGDFLEAWALSENHKKKITWRCVGSRNVMFFLALTF